MQNNQTNNETTIQVIAERINSMQVDVSDLRDTMRDSMEKMSTAVTKLVQIEERQIFMNQSYDRLGQTLDKMQDRSDKLESRVDALEREQPEIKRIVGWAYKALFAAAVACVSFIAKFVGLI